MEELTERQRLVLEFIHKCIEDNGYPPTIREIGRYMNIRSTNGVNDHLRALERKGHLQRQELKSRALVPTFRTPVRRGETGVMPTIDVPVVGRVAAGQPILAEENTTGHIAVDPFFLGTNKKVFALRVTGESMIEAGIFDGDYIFVKQQNHAEPDQIVVAMIEGEATVKRYIPEGDRVRFQPENRHMAPIYVNASDMRDVALLGVVVGVYRKVLA